MFGKDSELVRAFDHRLAQCVCARGGRVVPPFPIDRRRPQVFQTHGVDFALLGVVTVPLRKLFDNSRGVHEAVG